MSGASATTFHGTTGMNITDSRFSNSGRDTIINNVQNTYNIEVFPDVIDFIRTAAQRFVALTRRRDGKVDIIDIVPSDPSLLRVFSIADRYARSMMECTIGYPLYEPEPYSELSSQYKLQGVNVGDVGFVREDGTFDCLFNICPPQNVSTNPSDLPTRFSLTEHLQTRNTRPLPSGTCIFPPSITKTGTGEYTCSGYDGAVLVLPEGAIEEETINKAPLEDLAKRCGVEWYRYSRSRGRSIPNGSLYLVTSFIKCAQWAIAFFDRPSDPEHPLTFVNSPLGWVGSSAFATRVVNPSQRDTLNQCVFLRGYKIMLRKDVFNALPTRKKASRIRGGGGFGLFSIIGNSLNLTKPSPSKESDEPVLQTDINTSLVHPSDLINAELLSQYPEASVAITHDDVWCDLLQDNFPRMNYAKLVDIAQTYTSTVDKKYGCIYLEKEIPDSERKSSPEPPVDRLPDEKKPGIPPGQLTPPLTDEDEQSGEASDHESDNPNVEPNVDPPREATVGDIQHILSPVPAIQAILYDYPFSASILRELLQDSDNADATKQIFVLDKDNLALITYNDSVFLESDWQAIQRIHVSSEADPLKIGKYGVGFRACYHITDQPQILSGSSFVVFDPLNSRGKKIEYDIFKSTEQFKYFDFFSNLFKPDSFAGTAIRLPLRSSPSELSPCIVPIDELQQLISDFISEELDVSLLFLDKLKTIEVWETGNGTSSCLAVWTKSGTSVSRSDPSLSLFTYDSVFSDGNKKYSWRIVRSQITEKDATVRLAQIAGSNSVNSAVQKHKIRPDVRIAYPLTPREQVSGRLFTFLPLQSKTGFPIHIHALFALTTSRQTLRNPNGTDIEPGSEEDVLIKWNQLLFHHYIPQCWSYLLKTLAEDGSCSDIFEAWPPHSSSITPGDGVYWQDILVNTFKDVIGLGFKVWPESSRQGTINYIDLKSSLIVGQGQVDIDVLAVLAELGLASVQLPQNLLDLIDESMIKLSPGVAHRKLQETGAFNQFSQLSAEQKGLVCEYLLSDHDISNIFGLPLIPTGSGLQPISFPIFNVPHEISDIQLFEKLGVVFVSSALPVSVIHLLRNHNIPKNVNDLNHLLAAINVVTVPSLTDDEAQSIFRYATSYYGTISVDNLNKLRKLPVFPLLVPSDTLSPDSNSSVSWRGIDGIDVKGISPIQLVPLVGNMRYLSGPSIEHSLCSVLRQLNIPVLTENDIFLHALGNFTSQPKPLQAAFVSYIRNNQDRLHIITLTLRRVAFLRTANGSFQPPKKVIDPNSPLAGLFPKKCKDSRVPVNEGVSDQQLLRDLRILNLMKTRLDPYLVQERISYISSNSNAPEATAISRSLVTLMNEPNFSCDGLSIDPNMRWLPTARGLMTSQQCINSGRRDSDLFDEALFTLDGSISVSPSFKSLLDWDKPLPIKTLTEQLHHILDSQVSKVSRQKICRIIRELAGRRLRDSDIQDLQTIVGKRPWVPTKSGLLAPHSRAVFVNVNTASGFHEVVFSRTEKAVHQFLCQMGCLDRPTATAIIEELESLQEQSEVDGAVVQRAILLLNMLPDSMTKEEYQSVLVPDESGCLVPLSAGIYYRSGPGSGRLDPDERGTPVAHHLVTGALAKKLSMNRLDLEVEDDINLEGSGSPVAVIRNTLKQYDHTHFFTEFVANASDANAKYFSFLIDNHEGPTDKLISKPMKAFQSASLVVYNDGIFTYDDFKCIQMMGIGNKKGKSNITGYFGLGALSMFHFTEVAMIVSGSYVMFLNPARQNLAYQERDSVLFSLQDSKRIIPDHFEPLDGLFGFELNSTGSYQGTIFRLPLRNPSHLTNDPVSVIFWPVKEIENMLLKQFDDLAYKSLLFTGLDCINIVTRRGSQFKTLRLIEATRELDNHAPEALFKSGITTFKARNVQMKWFVLSQSIPIPEEFKKLLEKRFKKREALTIQFAAALDGVQEFGTDRNLFCLLPLSGAMPFPVHISAPFVLGKGRRNVRIDNIGIKSQFNRWLLSSEIPRLYLYLLELLLEMLGTNTAWWPPTRVGKNRDSIASQIIIDAFWSSKNIGVSSRQIFVSKKNPTSRLAPKDIVALVRNENFDIISTILDASNVVNVVEYPSESWDDVNYAGLRIVDTSFVKPLLEDPQVCQRLDRSDKYMALLRLCCDKISLHNLPLLPLEDGSFGTFSFRGDPDRLYYALQQAPGVAYPPFQKSRLISRDLELLLSNNGQAATWELFLRNYNISLLSENSIVELIQDYLKPTDNFLGEQGHQAWVDAFWNSQFSKPQPLAVSFFPLVPTSKPFYYISLQRVTDPSVIVLEEEPSEQQSHYGVLQNFGLVFVVRQALSLNLREILPTKRLGTYASFLNFVKRNPGQLGILRQLQADEQGVLSSWIRVNFSETPEDLVDIACRLPIWPVQQVGKNLRLAALNEDNVVILPPSMPTSLLINFSDHPLMDWEDYMKSVNKEPCTMQRILDLLHVSADSILPLPERAAYKEFVRSLIAVDKSRNRRLLVPNGEFVLQHANDLYEHSEPFIATFNGDSPFLLSQDFQDLAQDLEHYGLKRQHQLDLSMFIACAKAFDSERGNDVHKRERAFVLYQTFNSLQLSSLDSDRYAELDHLKFIPRVDVQRLGYDNINILEYMADLPQSLLAPSQITISEFEEICWSQRGQTIPPPNKTLYGTYQNLGMPDGADVLAHLMVLSKMAQEHGPRRGLLLDLLATYKWLDDHANDITGLISQKKKDNLFLNVDDPESDDWTWHCASNLVIGLQDFYDLHDVKGFLRNYKKLLNVAGIREIKKRTDKVTLRTTTLLDICNHFNNIRNHFNVMRQSEFGTDVVFEAQDNEYQILPAHKTWLAASNDHFRTKFITSGMKESRTLESHEPIRVEYSSLCVKGVINWFYVGKLPNVLINDRDNEEEAKRTLGLALDMLSLANEWEVTDLHEQLQVFIINDDDFINPFWVRSIQQHAEATMAKQLLENCQRYEEENRSIINGCTDRNKFFSAEERDTSPIP